MNKRHLTAALVGAGLAVAGVASPAAAASSSPAKTCRTGTVQGMPLLGQPEIGYFAKLGGCASSVAHGALNNDAVNLSALTTQAGYVQTCQAAKALGDWPAIAGEYTMFTRIQTTINNLPQCVGVLRALHSLPLGP